MTIKELKKLKKGDTVFLPIIKERYTFSVGNTIIGSSSYDFYKMYPLKVEDVLEFDFDPERKCTNSNAWYYKRKSILLKFDISILSKCSQSNYLQYYREICPTMFKGISLLDLKYDNYLEFNIPKMLNNRKSYSMTALKEMTLCPEKAEKMQKKMNKLPIQSIKQDILQLKKIKKNLVENFNKTLLEEDWNDYILSKQ
jgi:hypothetical protein